MSDENENARIWLRSTRSATLCTLSTKSGIEGFPFGSVVPYCLDGGGRPVILIATIAAHTRNLNADPRASLFVSEPDAAGDPQSSWRLTLTGRFSPVDDKDELPELAARYREVVPQANTYLETHGFHYWRLETTALRYIAGFGQISWLDAAQLRVSPLDDDQSGAIAHMNTDHVENMREMCRGLRGFSPERAVMTKLDATGFLVDAGDRNEWFSFPAPVASHEVRGAIIDVLKRARASSPAAAE